MRKLSDDFWWQDDEEYKQMSPKQQMEIDLIWMRDRQGGNYGSFWAVIIIGTILGLLSCLM